MITKSICTLFVSRVPEDPEYIGKKSEDIYKKVFNRVLV